MHHNPGVVRSCHPVDPAMAVARPPQALAATPVEIDLNHQGACYALDCWLRTQEVNGEPGDGSPEFFEYLEQIGIDFPESVVPPPQQGGKIKSHVKGSERDHRGHQNAAHAAQEPNVPGPFSRHSRKETLGATRPRDAAQHVLRQLCRAVMLPSTSVLQSTITGPHGTAVCLQCCTTVVPHQ